MPLILNLMCLGALASACTTVLVNTTSGRFHWAVQDAAGAMVVLEYVGGALHVHDAARVGVLTNDPEYEWHLKNLNQYALYSLDRVQEPDGPLRPFGRLSLLMSTLNSSVVPLDVPIRCVEYEIRTRRTY